MGGYMDAYTFGYYLGKYTTRTVIYTLKASLAVKGYRKLTKISHLHKINVHDAGVVTENVFNCLEYFDW
jgi:hypothetical protein